MIVENACLILQIFQMSDRETREEVPMNVMIHKPAEREAQLMQANREELVERIGRAMREDGTTQPLPGLHLYRHCFWNCEGLIAVTALKWWWNPETLMPSSRASLSMRSGWSKS